MGGLQNKRRIKAVQETNYVGNVNSIETAGDNKVTSS